MLLKKKFILGLTITSQLLAASQVKAASSIIDSVPRNVAAVDSESTGIVDEKTEISPEHAASLNHVGNILKDQNFLSNIMKMESNVISQWDKIKEKTSNAMSSELNRYRLSLTVGLDDKNFNLGKIAMGADTYYQMVVEPSYKTGKQLRHDIYVVGLRGSKNISAGTQIRITFFREFSNKSEAIFSELPYGLNKIPMNTKDLAKLKNQDGVRLEVLGNLSIGHELSKLAEKTNVNASISYGVDALFMMDLYKHDENTVRTRFIGTVNRGIAKIQGDLVAAAHIVNNLPGKVKQLFQLGLHFMGQKTYRPNDSHPIESHMVDYIFKFNAASSDTKKSATTAFDEILKNMKNGGFIDIYNPNLREEALANVLMSKAKSAEEISQEDKNKPYNERRVINLFKGRMSTNLASISVGMNLSLLARSSFENGNSDTHVTSIEPDTSKKYYILMNSFTRSKNSYMFGRSETEVISDLDALIDSDVNKKVGPLVDLVNRIQIRDKALSSAELSSLKAALEHSIPTNISNRHKIIDSIPSSSQKNALITFKYSMATEALAEINRLSLEEIYAKLFTFIDGHQDYLKMGLPIPNGEAGNTEQVREYIHGLAIEIKKSVDSNRTNEERLQTLRDLMKLPIFSRYIITEFLTSLLSSSDAERLLNLNINVSSAQIPGDKASVGKNKVSPIYDSVMAMRSIINDRSLDLRIETISSPNGGQGLEALNIMKFKPIE